MTDHLSTFTYHPYTGKDFKNKTLYVDVDPQPEWDYSNKGKRHGRVSWNEKIEKEIHFGKSPFKINDRLYEPEEWAHDGPSIEDVLAAKNDIMGDSHHYVLIRKSEASEFDLMTMKWQPASTMPVELAENFKIITGIKVKQWWAQIKDFEESIPQEIWQWALETKES